MRVMTAAETRDDELARLRGVQREYSVTIRVLAVIVELLLLEVGGDTILITDETLDKSPDLRAWRVEEKEAVAITVERS